MVVHEVLADEAVGYVPRQEVLAGGVTLARELQLWLSVDASVVVDRLSGTAAYPRPRASTRLFVLAPGQVRYRANFRFTGCACNPSWYYEDWVVHIGNGQVEHDRPWQHAVSATAPFAAEESALIGSPVASETG